LRQKIRQFNGVNNATATGRPIEQKTQNSDAAGSLRWRCRMRNSRSGPDFRQLITFV
jgi:hypothetical protein